MTTIDALRTQLMTPRNNVPATSVSTRVMSPQRTHDLFSDGMDRRTAASASTPVQPTSILGDVIGGAVGAIGSLVSGIADAFKDGFAALARGDILGAAANIPRAFINTALGGFGLFTDVALGLFTAVVDGVLGRLRG